MSKQPEMVIARNSRATRNNDTTLNLDNQMYQQPVTSFQRVSNDAPLSEETKTAIQNTVLQFYIHSQPQEDAEGITACYERLSQEDKLDGESNSISNQKRILEKYCRDHGYTAIRHYDEDDGYSGTNFNRPGFQRMLADIKAGKIKRVVVKDMSRFGRNYLQVGMYTEMLFPEYGVHFIAVNDGVDSVRGDSEFTAIRNVFKNISHSGKVSNDFSLFRRFCCINRCFRCSCGKFSIVHGVQAAIGFRAAAIGEKGDLPETHPVQPRTESKRPCRLTRAKPASKGSDRALSV